MVNNLYFLQSGSSYGYENHIIDMTFFQSCASVGFVIYVYTTALNINDILTTDLQGKNI